MTRLLPRVVLSPSSACARALAALALAALCPTLARAQSSPPAQMVEYYHTDALGSVRAVTKNGVVVSRHDFMPFGEEVDPVTPPPTKQLFTGQERDFETGNDYLSARYYGTGAGRLTQVDPLASGADLNPQRWNRYSYALNNPLVFTDPTGMDCVDGSMLPYWKMDWGDDGLWDASGDGWGWDIEWADMFGFPAYAFSFRPRETGGGNGGGGGGGQGKKGGDITPEQEKQAQQLRDATVAQLAAGIVDPALAQVLGNLFWITAGGGMLGDEWTASVFKNGVGDSWISRNVRSGHSGKRDVLEVIVGSIFNVHTHNYDAPSHPIDEDWNATNTRPMITLTRDEVWVTRQGCRDLSCSFRINVANWGPNWGK